MYGGCGVRKTMHVAESITKPQRIRPVQRGEDGMRTGLRGSTPAHSGA